MTGSRSHGALFVLATEHTVQMYIGNLAEIIQKASCVSRTRYEPAQMPGSFDINPDHRLSTA